MSVPPDTPFARPERIIADLQRQLVERTFERDEALARETATAEVLYVIQARQATSRPCSMPCWRRR
jgi:hypothetical protein